MKFNRLLTAVLCFAVAALPACAYQDASQGGGVRSLLSGVITVSPAVDPTKDYRGFEVLVAVDNDGEPDTLGFAVTDSTGAFAMDIVAPSRGRYMLVISRRGSILTMSALAVADKDTATVRAVFPMGSRPLRIRSMENSAWMAYDNTTAQHRISLLKLVQDGEYDEEKAANLIRQTGTILWGMQETFPGTMGAEWAVAEAVTMTANWDDSLAVDRALQVSPLNPRFVDVARAARAAQSRLAGQEAAIVLLEQFAAQAEEDLQQSTLEFEIIAAHLDSAEHDVALEKAIAFRDEHVGTPQEEWGKRAIYELENLIPGKQAPTFSLRDLSGDALVLEDLRGSYVLLEFYDPQDDAYEREMPGRAALAESVADLRIISISMAPDSLITEAFFDSRDVPGTHAIRPPGLAPLYNVNVLPTRFLIDAEGRIIAKYVGSAMAAIYDDLVGIP